MSADAEWEKWGKKDPYYGVLTNEKFRSQTLTDEEKIEFFESGREHIRHVIDVCRRHLDPDFSPKRVLDFGCGVGRLVIPLAEVAEYVLGLDVSDSMLQEALKNCNEYAAKNVSLLKSDDDLSVLDGRFNFIHSFIVFQHIPINRGRQIFANILNHLEEGGICAIHFTYSKANFKQNDGGLSVEIPFRKILKIAKRLVRRLAQNAFPHRDPEMQMNAYDVNGLFFLLQSVGINNLYLEFTDHGGTLGLFLYFQKPKKA